MVLQQQRVDGSASQQALLRATRPRCVAVSASQGRSRAVSVRNSQFDVSSENAGSMSNSRRMALIKTAGAAAVVLSSSGLVSPGMAQAKGGFETVKDQQDAYQFLYPFGWQEVSISGQDVVYKDVIEPLESVSVSYIPTEKTTIAEYGDVKEVSYTLVRKVLTTVNQDVKLVSCEERKDAGGRVYYDFEYTASTPRYTRHAMASVTVGNGKFYTLETGANERRWNKMADKIKKVQKSFEVFDRTDY
jgi:photosystem II oxygen-evolving enhancer protein 2